jgi:hypothetical protein
MSNNSISNSTITTAVSRFQGNTSNNGNGHTGHRQDTNNESGTGQHRHNNHNNGNNGRTRPSDNNWRTRHNPNNNGDNTQTRNRPPPNSDRDRDTTKPKFSGASEGMQGHIFGCSEEHGDRRKYTKTIAALQHHTSTFPHSEDFQSLFKTTPTSPVIEEPDEPKKGEARSEVKTLIFHEEVKHYVKRKTTMRSNLVAIWNTIIGQCTDLMKSKLESYSKYNEMEDARDCTWLLTTILSITLQFDNRRYPYSSLLDAYHKFFSCRQSPNQSVDDFRQNLILWSDVIEKYGGTLVFNASLPSKTHPTTQKPRTSEQRIAAAKQETLAMALLRGSDSTRYGSLLLDLANNFAAGRDNYPKDVLAAYALLIEYKTPVNSVIRNPNPRDKPPNNPNSTNTATTAPNTTNSQSNSQSPAAPAAQPPVPAGVTFTQAAQSPGSTAPTAPSPATTGTTLAHWAAMMAQHDHVIPPTGIDPSWILLDSQSTMSVFNNHCFLTDIHPAQHPIEAITNGGSQTSTHIGTFHGLGIPCPAWYNPESIANILSLAAIRKICPVTMDSTRSPSISVHRPDGTVMSFHEHPSGLYIHSLQHNLSPTSNCTLLATVAANKKSFTPREISQADDARRLYRLLGRPDEKVFRDLLKHNQIINCPLTHDDALRALAIYGPDIATLKGKMTRATAARHAPSYVAIPLPHFGNSPHRHLMRRLLLYHGPLFPPHYLPSHRFPHCRARR